MNKYVKSFLHRGLIFGGFGPIAVGIVFAFLDISMSDFHLTGAEILLATVSSYLLAFVQAGASVFNQIDEWPITKSLFCHFSTLFVAYTLCYFGNAWIPFEPIVILIFSLIFIVTYLVIWLAVYLIVRSTSERFNKRLNG